MSDINTLPAMRNQPSYLGFLVIRPEVEMQSALGAVALIKVHEVQPRQPIRLGANLELVIGGLDDDPAQCVSPHRPAIAGSSEWTTTCSHCDVTRRGHCHETPPMPV